MRIRWSPYAFAAILGVLLSGCDPADINVFMTNKTDRDIFVEFPMDQTGSHVKVPAHKRVQVLENVFGGAHKVVIIDAQSKKTIADAHYNDEWHNRTTQEIIYPQ